MKIEIDINVHFHDDHREAPGWAAALNDVLSLIATQQNRNQETIMAAIDDLKTAIGGLISEGTSDIAALVEKINAQSNQDPAIVALTQQVTDATSQLHTAFEQATGSPPPPAA